MSLGIVRIKPVEFATALRAFAGSSNLDRLLVATADKVHFADWRVGTTRTIEVDAPPGHVAISGSGNLGAWGSEDRLKVVALDGPEEMKTVEMPAPVKGLAVREDGRLVSAVAGGILYQVDWQREVSEAVGEVGADTERSWHLSWFHAGNDHILTGTDGRQVFVASPEKLLRKEENRMGETLAVFPNGPGAYRPVQRFLKSFVRVGNSVLDRARWCCLPCVFPASAAVSVHCGEWQTVVVANGYRLLIRNRDETWGRSICLRERARGVALGALGQIAAVQGKKTVHLFHNLAASLLLLKGADDYGRAMARLILSEVGGEKALKALTERGIPSRLDHEVNLIIGVIQRRLVEQKHDLALAKVRDKQKETHLKEKRGLDRVRAREEGNIEALDKGIETMLSERTERVRALRKEEVRRGHATAQEFGAAIITDQARQKQTRVENSLAATEVTINEGEALVASLTQKSSSVSNEIQDLAAKGAEELAEGNERRAAEYALTMKARKERLTEIKDNLRQVTERLEDLRSKKLSISRRRVHISDVMDGLNEKGQIGAFLSRRGTDIEEDVRQESDVAMLSEAAAKLKDMGNAGEAAQRDLLLPLSWDLGDCAEEMDEIRAAAERMKKGDQ